MENKAPGPSKGYQKQIKKIDPNSRPSSTSRKSTGLDYGSTTAKNWPRFIEALESGDVDALNELIKEGLNVNVTRDGTTPLMFAASKGRVEIAEAIIQAGANVNEKTDDGWTALHKAAWDQSKRDIIELLMQSGVDIEARNKAGKTALQLAEEKGNRDSVNAIKAHLQKLQDDAQEWEAFLATAEGRPYQQKRRYDSLAWLFKFWWLPPLALGGAGLLLGSLVGAVFLSGIVGLAIGLPIGFGIFFMEKKMRTYLEDIGPLPYLDIHLLREQRRTGEQMSSEEVVERPFAEEESLPKKTRYASIIPYVVVALIAALLVGGIIIKRTSLTQWYFAKRLERSGVRFTEQDFLNEVSKDNGAAVDLFVKAGVIDFRISNAI